MCTNENVIPPEMEDIVVLENVINKMFDDWIYILNNKRVILLCEARENFKDYESRKAIKNKSIKELESVLKSIEQTIRENTISEIRNTSMIAIEKEIDCLKSENFALDSNFTPLPAETFQEYLDSLFPSLKSPSSKTDFNDTPNQNNQQVIQIDYSTKSRAARTMGERVLNCPVKLAYDIGSNYLYVPDANNRRICVMTTEGTIVNEFGDDKFDFPCSVAVDESYCYIADSVGRTIYQFSNPGYEYIRKQKETPGCEKTCLSFPVDIKANTNRIYVADLDNKRVCVFNKTLVFQEEFGKDELYKPQYIQFHKDKIYVIDAGEGHFLHSFNRENHQFEERFLKKGSNYVILNAKSFCFGPDGSIIISDFDADAIKVLEFVSKELKMILKMGKDRPLSEVVDGCMGVVIAHNKIIVSCQRPVSCLKVF
ncbi:NHL repeat protein [Oopsacas minuta]|uniref:NHL repeat protein n=1 Tax=Oopsacas minuta TaxID=111878 RepID=A0AAV7JF22_9METZ|nr:NHL repeat protein [Oopsacas minuta]